MKQAKKFLRDEQGAELAEYAVGVAILVAIALVVYRVSVRRQHQDEYGRKRGSKVDHQLIRVSEETMKLYCSPPSPSSSFITTSGTGEFRMSLSLQPW